MEKKRDLKVYESPSLNVKENKFSMSLLQTSYKANINDGTASGSSAVYGYGDDVEEDESWSGFYGGYNHKK